MQISGMIDVVFFAGPKFSAGKIRTNDGEMCSFAGNLYAEPGQYVRLTGRWVEQPVYGRQFHVQRVELDVPVSAEGIELFLSTNPEFAGIGPARAQKIMEVCGDDFDRMITEEPERISLAAKIPMDVIMKLKGTWESSREKNALMTWLASFELTHHQSTVVAETLGNNAMAILKSNPYLLMRLVDGFGFKRIDVIARKMGTKKDNPNRIRAGILHCVHEALADGHCWIEWKDLIRQANELLVMDCLESLELIEAELNWLVDDDEQLRVINIGGNTDVALHHIYTMETELAVWFMKSKEFVRRGDFDSPGTLNEKQQMAFLNAFTRRISLISGGAGVGKSYCVAEIFRTCLKQFKFKPILCAPTGKAAKRMEELSGGKAYTIHRLLEYDGKIFKRDQFNPLETPLLIVDEVSMVDVPLAWHLFRAIDLNKTSVVLVGDHNQLPPVGPGNILRDLINTMAVPTTILDVCVRQAGALKLNSSAILAGDVRRTAANAKSDWYLLDCYKEPQNAIIAIKEMYEDGLKRLGFDPIRDVQVLTPTHKGPLGTVALNEILQRLVQKKYFDVDVPPHMPNRRVPIYANDKVIQTKNDYKFDLMNGAIGYKLPNTVEKVDGKEVEYCQFLFDGRKIMIEKNDTETLGNIKLAYALTFHKCQGSEFPCAVVIIHKSHSFQHHRNLFYTGVTRAQKTAIIVGDHWGVRNCAQKVQVDTRRTFLSFLLKSANF